MKQVLLSWMMVLAVWGCKDDKPGRKTIDDDKTTDSDSSPADSATENVDPVCMMNGESRCEGSILQICQDGDWSSVEACALTGKSCVAGVAGAACVAPVQETDTTDTDTGTGTDTGSAVDSETVVDTAPRAVQMGFCNTVSSGSSTKIVLSVEIGEGESKHVFSANTGCCDLCATVTVTPNMRAVLYSDDATLYETTIPITYGDEHLLQVILDPATHKPALGYIDLTIAEQHSCERYSSNAFGFCVDERETDSADAGQLPLVDAGR